MSRQQFALLLLVVIVLFVTITAARYRAHNRRKV